MVTTSALAAAYFAYQQWQATLGQLAVAIAQRDDARADAADAEEDEEQARVDAAEARAQRQVLVGANLAMAKASESQSAAAVDLAVSSRIANDNGRSLLRANERQATALANIDRPWISVEISPNKLEPAVSFRPGLRARNVGRSTAINITHTTFVGLVPKGEKIKPIEKCAECSRSTLATGDSADFPNGMTITEEAFTLVRRGDIELYIQARVDYKETNGATHVTEYCVLYMPREDGYTPCLDGNSAS